jgi:hypothetical protein
MLLQYGKYTTISCPSKSVMKIVYKMVAGINKIIDQQIGVLFGPSGNPIRTPPHITPSPFPAFQSTDFLKAVDVIVSNFL